MFRGVLERKDNARGKGLGRKCWISWGGKNRVRGRKRVERSREGPDHERWWEMLVFISKIRVEIMIIPYESKKSAIKK